MSGAHTRRSAILGRRLTSTADTTKSDSAKTGADDHDFPSDLIKLAIAHAKSDDKGQKLGASDAAYLAGTRRLRVANEIGVLGLIYSVKFSPKDSLQLFGIML